MRLFPAGAEGTGLLLDDADPDRLPLVRGLGRIDALDGVGSSPRPGAPLLIEHSRGLFTRPGLRGHRDGRDWSTRFRPTGTEVDGTTLVMTAVDEVAALSLRTEVESLPGGALRARHRLTNDGADAYRLEALELTVPLDDRCTEVLDFTGRHEGERSPQRHELVDGLWLRETRTGRPGLAAPTLAVAGVPGFGFAHGELVAVHVACSGNAVLRVERDAATPATIGGGELLLPGEVALPPGASYTMPWVYVVAADGLDAAAAALHTWQRTLPAHPDRQPVTLNVWEAVYFDHDLARLQELAARAARVGVERFVLDDGWFHGRRDDRAGLGDWWVDAGVWPDGLAPLIDTVHAAGMQFGLWFEPEMVNPDSELFRAHPDWVLQTGDRLPVLERNQLVLDLTVPEAWQYVSDRVDAVLRDHDIDAVKWDHNRDLVDAGSTRRHGAAAVHDQTRAFHALLADLRARHPQVAWESCAAGGGRIDLAVVEQVQRVWTSDLTDARARQRIQRWTTQLLAPEYLGAHVSAPRSHQTGRTFDLDLRAATAFFGAFGIEWDLTAADEDDLRALAAWVTLFKQYRPLLHSGRVVRLDVAEPAVQAHGVVARDGSTALLAHVQLDEATSNRGVTLRVPGLLPTARYTGRWLGPVDLRPASHSPGLDGRGPLGGASMTGAALERIGLWLPRRRPQKAQLMLLEVASER
ncbi:MAG: alpha-galactosidase [Jatrophihabitans sp.]|uniref:alpha-galactosidase n=1 Tax=Jatrophihabitans sp. TaxID=1932789 RepID=UPI003F7E2084